MKHDLRVAGRTLWTLLMALVVVNWAVFALQIARHAITGHPLPHIDRFDAAVLAWALAMLVLDIAKDTARLWKPKRKVGKVEITLKVDARALRRFQDEMQRAHEELARKITGPSARNRATR